MNYKKFIHPDSEGNPWGIVSAEQLWANIYAIKYSKPERRLMPFLWKNLFDQAEKAAKDFGAESLQCRIRLEYEPEVFRTILKEKNFQLMSGRIEYQNDVQKLPDDKGTPLIWTTAERLDWTPKQIVQFTKEVTKYALDVDSNENIDDFIQDWLRHKELSSGRRCIAIGYYQDQRCALAVVQTNEETGWSRISYMGLIPSFRGKGLGK